MLEGLNHQALLGAFVEKLVSQIIRQLMRGNGLQQLLSGNGLIPQKGPDKPQKPKKPKVPFVGSAKLQVQPADPPAAAPAKNAKHDLPEKPKADQGWQTVKRKKPARS